MAVCGADASMVTALASKKAKKPQAEAAAGGTAP